MSKTYIKNTILLLIYILSFLAFTHYKLQKDVNYMLLCKVFVFTSLLLFYILNSSKLNLVYLLAMALLTIADLSEIYLKENFIVPVSFFFASTLILIFLISQKMKRASLNFITQKGLFATLLGLVVMYAIIMSLNNVLYYIIGLAISLIITSYFAFIYYNKSAKQSSFWLLSGTILIILSFAFARINVFVIPYKYYSLIDSATYGLGLFFICKAILTEEKEHIEGLRI